MADREQFFSFEEALKELRLKEEELKRLVSEGEIRAFREGDTMKLRRADVENLRSELSGGEVVDLGEVREELVFEDDADLADETGMATEEISSIETVIEDDVEDVGELELDQPVAEEPEADVVVVRRPAPRAVVEDEAWEGGLVRGALVLTSLLLILALPLVLSGTTGQASGVARAIASLFGKTVP